MLDSVTPGGGSGGGDSIESIEVPSEVRAYCRTIEVLMEMLARVQAAQSTGTPEARAAADAELLRLNIRLQREILKMGVKKAKYAASLVEHWLERSDEYSLSALIDEYYPGASIPSTDPIDPSGLPSATNAGYTLVLDSNEVELGTGGELGIDGLAVSQPFAVGVTPRRAGSYSDADMKLVHYGSADLPTAGAQLMRPWAAAFARDDQDGAVRVSAFVWSIGASVDWTQPDLGAATRLDIELPATDKSRAVTAAGNIIELQRRQFYFGQPIEVHLAGPASTQVELRLARPEKQVDDTWEFPENGILLTTASLDAQGSAIVVLDLPPPQTFGTYVDLARLDAQFGSDRASLVLQGLLPFGRFANERLDAVDSGARFSVSTESLARSVGATTQELMLTVDGFEAGCKVRLYATERVLGLYSDLDVVEISNGAECMHDGGAITLERSVDMPDGQALRLTALVWPQGEAPNWNNRAAAKRFDILDVLPNYTLLEGAGSALTLVATDNFVRSGALVPVSAFITGSLPGSATVQLEYEEGVEGQFNVASPTLVATVGGLQSGDSHEFVVPAPMVTAPTVMRLRATVSSPTQQFAAASTEVCIAVYPSEQ